MSVSATLALSDVSSNGLSSVTFAGTPPLRGPRLPDLGGSNYSSCYFFEAAFLLVLFLEWDFPADDRFDDDFFDEDFLRDDFFAGTLPPSRRASESPMAIACLRLFTVLPERPLFSVPRLRSCIALRTLLCAFLPYLAMQTSVR